MQFQIRYAPSLANKPKEPKRDASGQRIDPFAHPPKDLFITDLSANHYLVLNKFPVTREHFILATTQYREQTHILEPDDLAATLECIQAYADDGQRLFAFFNCGEHSGASQPHRHIQLLPLGQVAAGLDAPGVRLGSEWTVLADQLLSAQARAKLPFRVFVEPLGGDLSGEKLHATYLGLYKQAFQAVKSREPSDEELSGEVSFSYNMAMTQDIMVLCPRIAEGAPLKDSTGNQVGWLGLNGTVLAGTALVKTEDEFKFLVGDGAGAVEEGLGKIGLPTAKL